MLALKGMPRIIERFRPRILIELKEETLAESDYRVIDIEEFLNHAGYEKFIIDEQGNVSHDLKQQPKDYHNYLFLQQILKRVLYLIFNLYSILGSEKKIPVSLDKSTFEQLFKTLFPSLSHFARKYVHDNDTAKEITHDVFLNLWEKRDKIDSSTSLKSYLFTSVYNRCMNYIRDQKKFNREEQVFNRLEQEEHIAYMIT